jgi:mannose/fructose/N-acetylgalactosamine-specific phosphotransferase system component IIB
MAFSSLVLSQLGRLKRQQIMGQVVDFWLDQTQLEMAVVVVDEVRQCSEPR